MQETSVQFLGRGDSWKRDRLPIPVFLSFPCASAGKESACSVGGLGSNPGLGRPPGEEKGYPLQYSGLENPMDFIFHGDAKDRTQLSDFHFPSYIRFQLSICLINQFSTVAQSYPNVCDPMDCSTPGYPAPSPTPGACSNSSPLSWLSHPVVPFSYCLQSFPAPGSFPMSQFLHQVAKVLELQLQHQSF